MDTKNITRKQLRAGFRGEFYRDKEYVGSVYLIDGRGLVLRVDDGRVLEVVEEHKPGEFVKVGSYQLSASQSVTKWSVK